METQLPQGINIKQIIDIALRRKAVIASCLLLAVTLGLARYFTQPKTYQGTALLTYQQQSINPAQMSPDEQAKIKDIVSTLSEVVTSRTNLEKVITNERLYETLRENLPLEDVIEMMRENISITPSRTGDTFIVTYDGKEPNKVARVTNTLASGFIEENMKYREAKASETSTYTQDELNMAKVILDKKEAVMRDYKLKHYNEMPEQRVNNMTRLASLQTQYQSRQESIQELERTRVLIRDQIEVRKQLLTSLASGSTALNDQPVQIETDHAKLARLRKNLEIYQERYTDQHPKIKSIKKKISNLEKRTSATIPDESMASLTNSQTERAYDATLFELQTEVKGIGLSIDKINKEKKQINKRIQQYEQWVGAAPIREAEWSALTREYGELKRHYDFLVSQNLQAGSALNLERKQKGSQFKIVDPARTPNKPTKPDFTKTMKFALLIGSALAGAIIMALETLNTSFQDPIKLSQTFGIEVICSVPHIPLKKEITKQRAMSVFGFLFFLCWTVSLTIAIFYFWYKKLIIL
ncbi:MAG: succinoglycan biosynthesis transport protein ExoP [Desulforhopalus sp.]|jgi:succinoglycan biosynthesis transport protein ExoP